MPRNYEEISLLTADVFMYINAGMKSKYKWTDEQLIEAVKQSRSIRQVLIKLSLNATGQNYRAVPKKIKELNLDSSHFTGMGWAKGTTNNGTGRKRTLTELLRIGSGRLGVNVKKRLIREGILKEECCMCKILMWGVEDKKTKLALHLDHINGINEDNRLENLRLLCPNCHSLTPTYAGKNKKSAVQKKAELPTPETLKFMIEATSINNTALLIGCSKTALEKKLKQSKNFCSCGKEKFFNAALCRSCQGIKLNKPKINWPSEKELIQMIKNSSYLTVGKKLGVSDNAIRKRLKNRGYNLTEISKEQ